MTSIEHQSQRIPQRKPGESPDSYNRRIAKFVTKDARPVQSKDSAVNQWREKATDLVKQGYVGFAQELDEIATGDKGISTNQSSPTDAGFANGSIEEAFNLTQGKPITTEDFLREVDRILNHWEIEGNVRLHRKGEFRQATARRVVDMRGLKEKGQELLQTA